MDGATEKSVYFFHSPSIPLTVRHNTSSPLGSYRKSPYFLRQQQQLILHHRSGHEEDTQVNNEEDSALFYVLVVLIFYVVAIIAMLVKYLRTEQQDNRLTRLYDEFMSKDWYLYSKFTSASKATPADKISREQTVPLVVKTEFSV